MALIKCRECGYDVSDKAYKCPNCGCLLEVEVTPEEIEVEVTPGITKEYEEEPQNRRTGLWILVAVLICAVLGGGYFVFDHFVNADDKDAIVELTPEFIKAVNQYDELGVFSEGRAAVKKGDKWGYINTKGEEVIPCQYAMASPFCEDMAAILKDGKWGYIDRNGKEVIPANIEAEDVGHFSEGLAFVLKDVEHFSIIDVRGKEICHGTCEINFEEAQIMCSESGVNWFDAQRLYMPCYNEGVICIPVGDDMEKVYDSKGTLISTREIETYSSDSLDTSEQFSRFSELQFGYENYKYSTYGLKDAIGNELIPAIYDDVNSGTDYGDARNSNNISNGVVLVVLDEVREESAELSYNGYEESEDECYFGLGAVTKRHYGYADLHGKDTFTDDVKECCAKSKEAAIMNLAEQIKKRKLEEGPDWLQGAWRTELTDNYGYCTGYMYEVFDHGKSKCYAYGQYVYEHEYKCDETTIQYVNGGHYQLDNERQVVVTADGKDMKKVSSCTNYVPSGGSSSLYSNSSYSSGNRSHRFSSSYDVLGWLSDKTFVNGNRRLNIRENGVWFNGSCVTGAPYVERVEPHKALIRARATMGSLYGYIVDPVRGIVIDESGDVFFLR